MLKPESTLPPPPAPAGLPLHAKWLAGEGAGSWFVIRASEQHAGLVVVSRYSPSGDLECVGLFRGKRQFDPASDYQVTYPSNCARVTVHVENERFALFNIRQVQSGSFFPPVRSGSH